MRIKAEYAGRVKRLFNRLRREGPRELKLPKRDPLDWLVLGILQRGTTASKAEAAFAHLLDHVVDYNDLRVTPVRETVEFLNQRVPDALQRAEAIRQALNGIFNKINNLNLVPLRDKPKKDAREFLEAIPGTDAYTVASLLLLGLGHSAFPLSDHARSVLQQERVLPEGLDTATAQTWLERHIPAAEAPAFFVIIQQYAAQKAPRWSGPSAPPAPPPTPQPPEKPAADKAMKSPPAKGSAAKTPSAKPAKSKRRAAQVR
jgi:endonuclease III